MKAYIKPEIDFVWFETESIMASGTGKNETGIIPLSVDTPNEKAVRSDGSVNVF